MGLHKAEYGPAIMNDSNGLALSALAKTATFDTAWYSSKGADIIGISINATVTGTSPTLDIDIEWSPDGGTSVFQTPNWSFASQNSGTADIYNIAYDIPQITATGLNGPYWFEVPWPANANSKYRLECTIGGTSPSFTLTVHHMGKILGR